MCASTVKARILVADDHPIVREGLVGLINRQNDLMCCAEAGSIAEAEKRLDTQKPDLMLLDLRMGVADGLEWIKSSRGRFPGLRILVVSQMDEATYAERVLRAGALGYVMKEQATEEVLNAIRQVLAGQLYVSSNVAAMAVHRMLDDKPVVRNFDIRALTDRELCVFKSVGAGKTNKQIAGELNLSVKTIETYREHIKYKLGLSSGAELVQRAKRAAMEDVMSERRNSGWIPKEATRTN
jgi:DNA-binding NarL/FixJ family response regulator